MLLLSTSSLAGYGLHRIFSFTKKASYDGIDLVIDFDLFDTYDAIYIQELEREHAVNVKSITAPERKLTKKQCEQILTLASDLDVRIVNLHPPHRLDKEKDWFGEYLQGVVKKYPNIIINIINAPPKTWLFVIAEYGDAQPETIKKITGHTALSIENVEPESGVDLMKTCILLGSTMNFVYLSDKTEEAAKLFPGEGNMPLESLLIKLSEVGYEGIFSLAVDQKHLLAGSSEDAILSKMEKAKKFLQKYNGKNIA